VKNLYLTYDDGPTPLDLPLMELLAKHAVKAVFFCTGKNLRKYPDIARLLVSKGHLLGNHTYDHKDLTKLTRSEIEDQIDRTEAALLAIIGYITGLFRAPKVQTNPLVLAVVRERGLVNVHYTAAGHDWRPGYTAEDTFRNVIKEKPGIILLHDTVPHTLEATAKILEHFKSDRFRFVLPKEARSG
jgi:peptidoglycan-N-acetylglucosamine deacetylase